MDDNKKLEMFANLQYCVLTNEWTKADILIARLTAEDLTPIEAEVLSHYEDIINDD